MTEEIDTVEPVTQHEGDDQEHECLAFEVSGQSFALHADVVRQVVAPPPVTPLPFAPDYLEGLVCINDAVLPLVQLAAVLFPAQAMDTPDAASEILVLDVAPAACAVRVDRVLGRSLVNESELRRVEHDDAQSVPGAVIAEFTDNGNSILLLDATALTGLAVPDAAPAGQRGLLGQADAQVDDEELGTVQQCLRVQVCGEQYGVPLVDVLEVLDDVRCASVPGAPPEVEGLALIRNEPLLVLSLGHLLGLGQRDDGRVVVVSRGEQRYGLRVEDVSDIAAFGEQAFRQMEEQDSALSGVLVMDDCLCGVLDLAGVLTGSRQQRYRQLVPKAQQRRQVSAGETVLMLHVKLADDDYAIPLHQVQRVVEYCAPEYLDGNDGMVSIAGEVVPTVSLARQRQACVDDDYDAWVVLHAPDGDVAVPVSSAHDIISVEEQRIDRIAQSGMDMVAGIVHVSGRMISVVDVSRAHGAGG